MNIIILLISLGLFMTANALPCKTPVDIYRTKYLSLQDVQNNYCNILDKAAMIYKSDPGLSQQNAKNEYITLISQITKSLLNTNKFAYVNISPIYYPKNSSMAISIDVVDKEDVKRMTLLKENPHDNIPDPNGLIELWNQYEKRGFYLMLSKHHPQARSCQYHHCLFEFEDSELDRDEVIFANRVELNKNQLATILYHDADENKRAASAYLLAYLNNENEIIHYLLPAIYDSSSLVRNNTMRVLTMIFKSNPHLKISLNYLIPVLDFPASTDRNKVLTMMLYLANDENFAKEMHRYRGNVQLLSHMQQPNIHDTADMLLKKI